MMSTTKPLFDYLKKQQENRKFLKSIELSATFILITFFLFFAIRPTLLTISALKGDIESKKILRSALKTKINDIIQAQELYSQVQEMYGIVNTSLPDKPNYFDAAFGIQSVGQSTQINVDNLVFNLESKPDSKVDPNLHTYNVNLDVNGNYSSALELASQLLNNRRVINIAALNFEKYTSPTASDSAGGDTVVRFSPQFYYWPTTNEKK